MKRIFLVIFSLFVLSVVKAQLITHDFRNVSMSDALQLLNKMSHRYTINFIYNDLEDFRVTTDIKRQTLPDAIRQMIGFYPITIAFPTDSVISVECSQRTSLRYKGRVVDENGLPAEYANIVLLSPSDSAIIGSGVSNASGFFVIPCEARRVIARISYIGYRTMQKVITAPEMGIIKLQPQLMTIKGVVVNGNRPRYKMVPGGTEVTIENTLMAKMASTMDVLSLLPRVNVSGQNISVFGKGAPLIYINNKRVLSNNELFALKPDDIKSISVITNPGAEYDAEVESVIRIRTKSRINNGLSIRADAFGEYTHWLSGFGELITKYQTKKFEVINNIYVTSDHGGEDNHLQTDLYSGDYHHQDKQYFLNDQQDYSLSESLVSDYSLNDSNSIGASYQYYGTLYNRMHGRSRQDITLNGNYQGGIDMTDKSATDLFFHQANMYYVGKMGNINIDFNASYFFTKDKRNDQTCERSHELGNQDVHSDGLQRSDMWAGKLILTLPVWKGNLKLGTETSKTNSHGIFNNLELLVEPSNTDIKERNLSAFTQYELSFDHWDIDLGLRYEYSVRDYFEFGVKRDDVSRKYRNFFPNLMLSWNKGDWYLQLNINDKIHRPSYHDLRNFRQYDNRFLFEGGNPSLRPEKIFNAESSLMYKWINVSVGYKYIDDVMSSVKYAYPQKAYAYTTTLNFGNRQLLYASAYLSPKFGMYQPSLEVDYEQQFFDTKRYGARMALRKPRLSGELNNLFAFSDSFDGALIFRGSTAYSDGFLMYKGNQSVDLQFSKSFANRKWVVYFMAKDIFKTNKERWTMYGINAETIKNCYNYSRSISLQVTYNFNAKRSKYRGTGAGDEEKNRL